jgi:hypothetical protein
MIEQVLLVGDFDGSIHLGGGRGYSGPVPDSEEIWLERR